MERGTVINVQSFAKLAPPVEFGAVAPAPFQAIAAGMIGALAVVFVAAMFLATIL